MAATARINWTRKDLVDIETLSREEIELILYRMRVNLDYLVPFPEEPGATANMCNP